MIVMSILFLLPHSRKMQKHIPQAYPIATINAQLSVHFLFCFSYTVKIDMKNEGKKLLTRHNVVSSTISFGHVRIVDECVVFVDAIENGIMRSIFRDLIILVMFSMTEQF